MAKRYTDTTIWKKQRWFIKLSPMHKLAWKYITDTCDHAGILKIDFSEFIDDLGVEEFDISSFIKCCNVDFDKKDGKKVIRERIKLIKDGVFWITGFIKFQYESRDFNVNPSVPAIYSALTLLNSYGTLNEGLTKGYFTLSKPYVKGMLRTKDKDKDIDKDKENNNNLWFLKFFHSDYENYKKTFNGQSTTEKMFCEWKGFIQFIYDKGFTELFECKFLAPHDYAKLASKYNFAKDKWEVVLKSILATGVKPEHNLFFRIPQFMKYEEKNIGNIVPEKIEKTQEELEEEMNQWLNDD